MRAEPQPPGRRASAHGGVPARRRPGRRATRATRAGPVGAARAGDARPRVVHQTVPLTCAGGPLAPPRTRNCLTSRPARAAQDIDRGSSNDLRTVTAPPRRAPRAAGRRTRRRAAPRAGRGRGCVPAARGPPGRRGPRMSRTAVVGTRGVSSSPWSSTLGARSRCAAAAALAASARQISESPSKSSTGRTLRHFWQRRQFAAMSPRPSSFYDRLRRVQPPATERSVATPPGGPQHTAAAGPAWARTAAWLSTRRGRRHDDDRAGPVAQAGSRADDHGAAADVRALERGDQLQERRPGGGLRARARPTWSWRLAGLRVDLQELERPGSCSRRSAAPVPLSSRADFGSLTGLTPLTEVTLGRRRTPTSPAGGPRGALPPGSPWRSLLVVAAEDVDDEQQGVPRERLVRVLVGP